MFIDPADGKKALLQIGADLPELNVDGVHLLRFVFLQSFVAQTDRVENFCQLAAFFSALFDEEAELLNNFLCFFQRGFDLFGCRA